MWRIVDRPRVLGVLGEERFVAGLAVRQARLDRAALRLAEVRAEARGDAPSGQELVQAWPTMIVRERRNVLFGVFDCIFISPGYGRPKDRCTIFRRGEAPPDLPRRGKRGAPLRPLRFERALRSDFEAD